MANNNFKFNKKRRMAPSYKVTDDNGTSFKLTKIFKREVTLTIMSIIGVTIIMLGGSYSIFSTITKSKDSNVLKTGTLALEFNDTDEGLGNVISLNGEYPISDSEGLSKKPYTFKITNTGSIDASYKIQILDDSSMIEEDGCINNLLRKEVIKYSIDGESPVVLSSASDGVVKTGTLTGGESVVHNIKMWISDLAENSDLGKHYHGKILVEAIQDTTLGDDVELPRTDSNDYNSVGLEEKHDMFKVIHTDGSSDYRFIGNDPYNYLKFEGDNTDTVWRIIGLFNDQSSSGDTKARYKIMRNESIGNMSWDNNNSNNWGTSTLQSELNLGLFWNNLSQVTKDKIEEMNWYLGSTGGEFNKSADVFYNAERGGVLSGSGGAARWVGFVGLMYPSDFLYTYSNGVGLSCYNGDVNNCKDNRNSSWMLVSDAINLWMITASSDNPNYLSVVKGDSGSIQGDVAVNSNAVFPVVYLKSNVNIIRGNGSLGNPYIIGK